MLLNHTVQHALMVSVFIENLPTVLMLASLLADLTRLNKGGSNAC